MSKGIKNISRLTNKLSVHFFSAFGLVCSIMVVIIGIVFMRMYEESVINEYVATLENNAKNIAMRIEEYAIEDASSKYLDYMAAIESVFESQMVDVWVMPYKKAENRLKSKYTNVAVSYKSLSKGMQKVVKKVFTKDVTASDQGYDEIYDTELVRAAAPIHDDGGNVVGVVLLNGVVAERIQVIDNAKRIVIVSLLIAWISALLLALFFSNRLSKPISVIRKTALRLADGEYAIKTGITKRGEIGELSDTMNMLSDRLAVNEYERERLEQGRRDFFANVSHELRTPITVIRGYTESLADGYVTEPDKVQHTYERMLRECRGIERLVGDLIILSRMQNPDFKIEKEPVSVVQVFEDVTRNARVLGESRGISINFNANDEYCFVMGDYDRLRQMFMVIMDNAIKFSHDNSSVDIDLNKEDSKLCIAITDHGVGISDEELPNIFDKFYHSKLQMNEKGSGLGLQIAKSIALKHNGTIDVTSKKGEGTTFTFILDSINIDMID